MGLPTSTVAVLETLRSRLLIPAVVALGAGIGGVAFGLSHDDVVTALGALLFVPSALLLFGIVAKRRGVGPFAPSRRRPN
jgi:ABC-type transport system involved in cytochrome bd biosynthesis fused ATPase/permease subunit